MRTLFQRGSRTALAVLAGLGTARAVAQIDPGQELCPGIDCASVAVGPFTPPTGWALKPDRRPGFVIHTWTGSTNNNSLRLNSNWYDNDLELPNGPPTDTDGDGLPDAFEWLLSSLDEGYDLGYRRIIMRLPAGSPADQIWASSQWWTMPKWKRTGLQTHVTAWLDAKELAGDPVTLGIIGGYRINDPCSLSMAGAHGPDPTSASDMCVFYQNVKPWMDVGITEYWFDAASGHWSPMVTLQHSPDYSGLVRFGGEAVPFEGEGCDQQRTPVPAAVAAGPWFAFYRFVVSRFGDTPIVDPNTTDLAVLFNGHHVSCGPTNGDEWVFDDLKRLVDAGWVAWTDGQQGVFDHWKPYYPGRGYTFDYSFRYSIEAVRRVYDFGELTAVIDFNNDGLLEVGGSTTNDLDAFAAVWNANYGQPGGYLDGDVNGDGVINIDDITFFTSAANAWTQNDQLVGVDLGPAWWHP